MGIFSKLFRKKNDNPEFAEARSFNNPECQKICDLKLYIDNLLSKNQYVAKSEYADRLLEDSKTIEFFNVLQSSGTIQSFCKSNKLNTNDVKQTLEKYRNIEKLIDQHNERYVERTMIEEKSYLDNILRKVDPKITLDDDQRRVVLTDEDYCLVIAGAGAGKADGGCDLHRR